MTPSLLSKTLGAIGFLLFANIVSAQVGSRQPASPGYAGRDACPERCSISGPNPSNWSAYHNFDEFQSCQQTLFYEFNINDEVDDANSFHRIFACTSYGPDWINLPNTTTDVPTVESVNNATYEVGWWSDGGKIAVQPIRTLSKQLRQYLANGYGPTNKTVLLFAQSGPAAVGVYIGKGLQNEGISSFALKTLEDNMPSARSSSIAIQLCEGHDSEHIFGFMATSNGTFTPIQDAIKSWASADCLSFAGSKNYTGSAQFISPLITVVNGTNSTTSDTDSKSTSESKRAQLFARANCKTTQVQSGDGCAALAQRCGISAANFTKYNPGKNFCATLKPQQHVCCSAGTLPDFAPKPNADGSCHTYKIQSGDSCSSVAAANSLEIADLETFNKKTWAWNGCANIWSGTIVCLSKGTPPMPAAVANTVCGPQVPGTQKPTNGEDISKLNPCPLNACCDVWGQCGTTAEFCTNSSTGAPGTAKAGTNGCISNCGTTIVRSDAPAQFRKLGYFEGFSFSSRDCLYQDALQIDPTAYTHLHFAFGTITADYEVKIGDVLTTYEFNNFLRISGPKRILSFGGWDFSTNPSTYNIFRQGVTPANRVKLATNIANFIKSHDLDGVDIDWEYPSAPDIPNIPPGSKDEGGNYLAFLSVLKNLLPGKSVSIAAPASYWYLKGFPIKAISNIVDYIVYMTYDLHGQWDAQNQNSQIGCPSGMCLRSDVNLTETINSLVMVTKAGVPSNQLVVGVTSYGRSFAMAEAGCHTPECRYTGTALHSNAKKGKCTATAGYIADAEIQEILKNSSRVNTQYLDATSNSNILVYDDIQWVGYMNPTTRASRTSVYKGLNMGGTTDWAIDLESYNDPPSRSATWAGFMTAIESQRDPYTVGTRHGNWTSLTCTDPSVEDIRNLTSSQRWNMMDAPDAWTDIINVWKTVDKPAGRFTFMESVSDTIHGPELVSCGVLLDTNNCDQTLQCDTSFEGSGSGPAGYEIYNSLVIIHEMYQSYYAALIAAAATEIDPSLQDFENKFAPVPAPPDNTWLLILLDFITLGAAFVAAPFFNSFLAELPYFIANEAALATLKDTSFAIISSSTSIAKDLSSSGSVDTWTAEKQAEFSNYMGQTVNAWGNITELSLSTLFDGSDTSITTLTSIISDGKLIEGNGYSAPTPSTAYDATALEASVGKAFFTYAIPSIWAVSGTYPFILDTGYACDTENPITDMDPSTAKEASGCVNGKLYYLASPKGPAQHCSAPCLKCTRSCDDNYFSAPPGIDSLDGKTFGGVTVANIIQGSINTYTANGNQNGGKAADPSNQKTFKNLLNQDVTTAGYIRIPVCSSDIAFQSWLGVNGQPDPSAENYPCNLPAATSDCGSSTFVDQTSDASPKVSDCQQIVKNIQHTNGKWEVENALGEQHDIVDFGSCKFGVQGIGKNGNIEFYIGAQDVVDIINASISKFGGSGVVGAKGDMSCSGNVKGQDVEWGIY